MCIFVLQFTAALELSGGTRASHAVRGRHQPALVSDVPTTNAVAESHLNVIKHCLLKGRRYLSPSIFIRQLLDHLFTLAKEELNDTSQVIRDNELSEEQWKKGYPRGRRPSFYARTKHPAGGQVINEAVVEKPVVERVPSVTIEDTWPADAASDELSRPLCRTA